jgi:hypothetical protein
MTYSMDPAGPGVRVARRDLLPGHSEFFSRHWNSCRLLQANILS